jgi:hypothetical protein
MTIVGVVGIPLFVYAIGIVGEVKTNHLRLDHLEHEVARLAQRDEDSAKDRRDLDNRVYRLEDGHERVAPTRGRE